MVFEEDIGPIVPFKSKRNKEIDYNRMVHNSLVPDDLLNLQEKKNSNSKNSDSSESSESPCEITGEIVPYKGRKEVIPPEEGGPPGEGGGGGEIPPGGGGEGGGVSDSADIYRMLKEHHTLLQQIVDIQTTLKDYLTGYNETGTYFELRTQTLVATIDQPQTPDTITNGVLPGYSAIDVNKQKQGKNAQKLWIINDGPTHPGLGDNLYVITSSDGSSFSPEFTMIVGETRLVNNVYEVRFRSPRIGNVVRVTEREAIVPYVTTVTNTLSPVENRDAITARRIGFDGVNPITSLNVPQLLPDIAVPDSFSLAIRSWVFNPDNARIYIAGDIPAPGPAINNVVNAATRISLAPGDKVIYTVSNANKIAVYGPLVDGQEVYLDLTVEV